MGGEVPCNACAQTPTHTHTHRSPSDRLAHRGVPARTLCDGTLAASAVLNERRETSSKVGEESARLLLYVNAVESSQRASSIQASPTSLITVKSHPPFTHRHDSHSIPPKPFQQPTDGCRSPHLRARSLLLVSFVLARSRAVATHASKNALCCRCPFRIPPTRYLSQPRVPARIRNCLRCRCRFSDTDMSAHFFVCYCLNARHAIRACIGQWATFAQRPMASRLHTCSWLFFF